MLKKIVFDKEFDLILCLDAILPEADFFYKYKNIPIYAADGAALQLLEMGIMPDMVVGDLDTLMNDKRAGEFDKERIICIENQDYNDFEKTLFVAKSKGFANILITGFQGGELEHTLNNWSIFKKYAGELNMCIYDLTRYGFVIDEDVEIAVSKDEMISILPQPEIRLTTQNLKWELQDERLVFGKREGIRNRALSEIIRIYVSSGSALLFINERMPFCPRKI